jgi:two-component system, NtrC family, response regulator AtoC
MNTLRDEIDVTDEGFSFVASSPSMMKIRARAELLAKVDVPVLIVGESGSGKEAIARLIHRLSARSGGKFAKINCASLGSDLAESELFASKVSDRTSTQANSSTGGFLLLQEVADLPMRFQAKVLAMLQEAPPHDNTPQMNIRILATTSVKLQRILNEKRLREDLYYRLSAFTIELPPLRERTEEFESLLACFMERTARHHRLLPRQFSPAMLEACQRHTWPGNLRELENFVQRYLVLGDEAIGDTEQRSAPGTLGGAAAEIPSSSFLEGNGPGGDTRALKTLVRSLKDQAEKNAIANVLEKTGWNRKRAAHLLGISYRGLLYKIEQHQLARPFSR